MQGLRDTRTANKRGWRGYPHLKVLYVFWMLYYAQWGWASILNEANQFSQDAHKERLVRELYFLSGFSSIINRVDGLIYKELETLKATKETLSSAQIQTIERHLREKFSSVALREKLLAQMRLQLSVAQLQRMVHGFDHPMIKASILSGDELGHSPEQQMQFSRYQVQLKARPPIGGRVEAVRAVVAAQGLQNLEVLIRTELRSALLNAVQIVKGHGAVAKARLGLLVQGYQQSVAEQLGKQVLYRSLFLLRYVPTEVLAEYTVVLKHPQYREWLGLGMEVLTQYFSEARSLASGY